MTLTQEKKKQILAGILFATLLGALYYNFFSGDDEPSNTGNRPSANATKKSTAQGQAANNGAAANEPLVNTPLALASMSDKAQTAGAGRNIFIYPTPTPPPPPPVRPTPTPTPPPPITLVGVSPAGVIARTADFTLTVMGAKIPPDARAFINGIPYSTNFINESQIKVAVTRAAIAGPGQLRIEVRSAQDPKIYSNPVSLNVTAPPSPPFRYVGLMIKNGVYTAIIKSELDEDPLSVVKGQTIGGHWRITNITEDGLEIVDTNINVSHPIKYTGDSG
jgi:hypothetical protein